MKFAFVGKFSCRKKRNCSYGFVLLKINIELCGSIGLTTRAVCSFRLASASAAAAAALFFASSSARAFAAAAAAGSRGGSVSNDAKIQTNVRSHRLFSNFRILLGIKTGPRS